MSLEGQVRLFCPDLPWPYGDRKKYRKDNPLKETRLGTGAHGAYSAGTMTAEDVFDLKPEIQRLMTPDAYMLMWAVMPRLDFAMEAMKHYGFQYRTTPYVWVKVTENGKTCKLPGAYTLSNVEVMLLGRPKGTKCWHSNAKGCYKPAQVIHASHPRDPITGKIIHSRKPDIFYEDIEKWLFPYLGEGKALEMFATKPRDNWLTLGHALTGTYMKEDLRELLV